MLRSSLKNFIRLLPGPFSYCSCTRPCSPLEIEHVVPRKILKTSNRYAAAARDPHNLFMCCRQINQSKNHQIYGHGFFIDDQFSRHHGALARACLYMTDVYELRFPPHIIQYWFLQHKDHPPHAFEWYRQEYIFERTLKRNHYLDDSRLNRFKN